MNSFDTANALASALDVDEKARFHRDDLFREELKTVAEITVILVAGIEKPCGTDRRLVLTAAINRIFDLGIEVPLASPPTDRLNPLQQSVQQEIEDREGKGL